MRSPPTGLLVKSLLVSFNTVPALVVRPVVRTERLDDMRGFAVTAFAAMHYEVFDSHLNQPVESYYVLLSDERQSRVT